MSEERLRELGIPRRKFLKSTAAAAFVAPVVVSFGLEGTAAADTGSFSNQCFSNQYYHDEQYVFSGLAAIAEGVGQGALSYGVALSLSEKLLHAGLELANCNDSGACRMLNALLNEVHGLSSSNQIPGDLADELIGVATSIRSDLGCAS